jgi:prepilin-type N-terminal cleavage/methylation domain-containing protein
MQSMDVPEVEQSRGFSLPEVIVTAGIVVVISAAILALISGASQMSANQQSSIVTDNKVQKVLSDFSHNLRSADRIVPDSTATTVTFDVPRGNTCERFTYAFINNSVDVNRKDLTRNVKSVSLAAGQTCSGVSGALNSASGLTPVPAVLTNLGGPSTFFYFNREGFRVLPAGLSKKTIANCSNGQQFYPQLGTVELTVDNPAVDKGQTSNTIDQVRASPRGSTMGLTC